MPMLMLDHDHQEASPLISYPDVSPAQNHSHVYAHFFSYPQMLDHDHQEARPLPISTNTLIVALLQGAPFRGHIFLANWAFYFGHRKGGH